MVRLYVWPNEVNAPLLQFGTLASMMGKVQELCLGFKQAYDRAERESNNVSSREHVTNAKENDKVYKKVLQVIITNCRLNCGGNDL